MGETDKYVVYLSPGARGAIGTNVKKFVLGGDLPEQVRDKLKRAQPKVGHHVEFVN
jgi:hypothetical protein